MALWGGRFAKDMDQIVKEFNASIGFLMLGKIIICS